MPETLKLSRTLNLPAEICGRRTGVFGISGSGKSNTATVIIERSLDAGEQVVLVDPKGEGWGLLSLSSGRPSKFDVIIFGEPNGHIPAIKEEHGQQLADFVVETGRSIVLSLLGFESDQSERRFVAKFLRQLYRRKTKQAKKTRTLVVFEEAHLFMPEGAGRGQQGDTAELSGACQRIVRQGRSFGLGSLVVDQRPQDVAKRIVTQLDTLICHQLVHKLDRAALADWVKGHDRDGRGQEFLDSLAALAEGEAWVWSPAWLKLFERVKVDRRRSFDSGAAPDDSAAVTIQRKAINLDRLKGQLDELVAKQKADDPQALRKRIAELERLTATRPSAPPKTAERVIPDQAAIDRAVKARDREWQQWAKAVRSAAIKQDDKINRLRNAIDQLGGFDVCAPPVNKSAQVTPSADIPVHKRQPVLPPPCATRPAPRVSDGTVSDGPLAGGEARLNDTMRRVLTVIAQREDMGHPTTDQATAATLAGVRVTGSFRTYLSTMRAMGVITGGAGALAITAAGRAQLGDYEDLPRGQALLEFFKTRHLNETQGKMLDEIIGVYPGSIEQDRVAETIGVNVTGSFRTYLSTMRRIGVIEGGASALRATDRLMEGVHE